MIGRRSGTKAGPGMSCCEFQECSIVRTTTTQTPPVAVATWPRRRPDSTSVSRASSTRHPTTYSDVALPALISSKSSSPKFHRPYFKRTETFHIPDQSVRKEYLALHDAGTLGTSGPIHVSYASDYSASHRLWHATLNQLGVETNAAHLAGSNVGVWTNLNSVNPGPASRSFSTEYLLAAGQAANLHVLTEATVRNVVLKESGVAGDSEYVATGVRFRHGNQEYVVPVRREVILSAGTVSSPRILEMSGVGNTEILSAAGIPVKVNSPMVGENLQDHIS